jgi:Flp pilus assembly protein TadD, contains TPR repeats
MKKLNKRLKAMLIIFMAMIPLTFFGQEAKKNYFFVTADGGGTMLFGDNDFKLKDTRANGHLGIGYQFGGVLGTYGKIGYGAMYGESKTKNFKTDELNYFEGNINLSANMMNLFGGYNPDRLFSIVPHVGIGQIHYRVKALNYTTDATILTRGFNNDNANNAKGKGIDGRKVILTLPMGLTFDFNVAEKWAVFLDGTINWTDTKALEGVDSDKYDWFGNVNVGVKYKVFKKDNLQSMITNFDVIGITTTPEVLEEQGNMVNVTIQGTIPPKYFNPKAVMNLTPILSYENGETILPSINLKGEDVAGNAIPISYKDGGTFTYTTSIPYSQNMNKSILTVEPIVYVDKGVIHEKQDKIKEKEKFLAGDIYALAEGVIATSRNIDKSSMQTAYVSDNNNMNPIITEDGGIYFQVNMANLNWKLPLNQETINQTHVKNLMDNAEKGWIVKDITVEGYASPEGPENFNKNLSVKRANTASKYVKGQLSNLLKDNKMNLSFNNVDDINFEIAGKGPDWQGFIDAVRNSNIKDKNAIVNVIMNSDQSKREAEIANMIKVYPELESIILPELRRAVINVNTMRPKLTDEEIAVIVFEDPSQLTCQEIIYAATLFDEPNKEQEIYNIAISTYPDCPDGYVNAAIIEIENGNYQSATDMLNTALSINSEIGEAYNNLGIIAMMKEDYITAEAQFIKAQSYGINEDYNLGVIEITKGNYAKAISLMQDAGANCDYNLALAQTMHKKYTLATETLACSDESGPSLYLQSVIALRTKDIKKSLALLEKAVKKDPSLKRMAKMDREFLSVQNNPKFLAIID